MRKQVRVGQRTERLRRQVERRRLRFWREIEFEIERIALLFGRGRRGEGLGGLRRAWPLGREVKRLERRRFGHQGEGIGRGRR